MADEIWLIRHGETAWTLSGQHTGRTDVPLTPRGEEEARAVGARLQGQSFSLVLCSPLQRARRTCEIAGFLPQAILDPECMEWDYGDLNGRTREELRAEQPGWNIWNYPAPHGESLEDVAARAARVLVRIAATPGRSSPMATSCASLRRPTSNCRPRPRATSHWPRAASRCSA
jgi:probable phosphoglycerate mutase